MLTIVLGSRILADGGDNPVILGEMICGGEGASMLTLINNAKGQEGGVRIPVLVEGNLFPSLLTTKEWAWCSLSGTATILNLMIFQSSSPAFFPVATTFTSDTDTTLSVEVERYLKITSDVNRGLGASTDGCETKSNKR